MKRVITGRARDRNVLMSAWDRNGTGMIWIALVGGFLLLSTLLALLPDVQAGHRPSVCRMKRFARPLDTAGRLPVLVSVYQETEMCILRVDPRTGAMHRVARTDGPGYLYWPTYSPDKRLIAFERYVYRDEASTEDLYVVNADATGEVRVATDTLDFGWSPASNEIVYGTSKPSGGTDVFITSADGSVVRPLPPHTPVDPGWRGCPRWSPKGDEIYYHRWEQNNNDVYAMNMLEATERRVVGGSRDEGVAEWSNDGSKIAFVRVRWVEINEARNDIFVVDASGGQPVAVTDQPGLRDRHYAWSPDGSMIAYSAYRNPWRIDTKTQLWVAAADGSWRRRLKYLSPGADRFSWSPNSRRVAFVKEKDVWTIRVDGKRERRVTDLAEIPGARAVSPSWASTLSCYATGL